MNRCLLPLFLIAFAFPWSIASAFQSPPNDKRPIPSEADQKQASQLVGSLFKKEYDAAQTPQQRSELAKKMFRVGVESQADDPLGGYVLLRIAKDVAADAGDVDTAMSATEQLSEHFEVDGLLLKTEILKKASNSLRTPKGHQELAAHFQAALDEAIAHDRFDLAKSINTAALASARQSRSVELVKQIAASVKETEELEAEFQKSKAAFVVLETSPTDPEANLLAGRYQCFIKGDWEEGVLKLALGGHEPIKKLALLELNSPDPLRLGDGWWEIAEGHQGRMAANIQNHAVEWYSRATDLKGLTKIKVDQRIAEFSAKAPPVLKRGVAPSQSSPSGSRAGEERQFTELKIKFCWCPAGRFTMGSQVSDSIAQDIEKPPVDVTLSRGFWLGKYEVTQEEFARVANTTPWHGQARARLGAKYPATFVTWHEASAFCQKLTERERQAGRLPADWGFRLPTEAEWEYACRAGTTTSFSCGDDESVLWQYAWYQSNANEGVAAFPYQIGLKKPNPWGLHDMHGNVWEWCSDWRDNNYYQASPGVDPVGPSSGIERIIRSGAWLNPARAVRSALRAGYIPSQCDRHLGFRLVLSTTGQ